MNYKLLSSLLLVVAGFLSANAQQAVASSAGDGGEQSVKAANTQVSGGFVEWCRSNNVFNKLDVAGTLTSAGLGLEVQTPVTKWTNLRLGFEGYPQVKVPMNFNIVTYADGNVTNNFNNIKELMYKITGEEMHENVTVNGRPKMMNFKMLVDIFPFQNNRHWHVTAGFYLGSRKVASAVNDKNETNSLVAMNIYNRFYDRLKDMDYRDEPLFGDVYLSEESYNELMSYGQMGVHIGDYKDGKPYYLKPTPYGVMSAKAMANAFKPYLGVGYSGALDKEKRWNIGVEVGALFWGGAPQVILNDGTNMNKDLINVRGKVGDYLKIVKALPVLPVVGVKLSYSIF